MPRPLLQPRPGREVGPTAEVVQVWSLNWQYQPLLGTHQDCRISGPGPPPPPEAESGHGGAVFEQVPQVILEQLKLEKPLEQASTNLFYKGPHGKHVELSGPGSYGVLPLRQSSQRQYANG